MKKFTAQLFFLVIVFQMSFAQENRVNGVTVKNLTDTLRGSVGGMSIDIIGDLYVADFTRTVWRISRWGEIKVYTDAMYGASGNAIDVQGNLYQSEYYGKTISKVFRTGEIKEIAHEGIDGPVGIAISEGNLYVCSYPKNAILKVSQTGEVSEFSKSDLFVGPNGITIGPRGEFYVVNFRDPNVVKIDKDGNASVFVTLPTSTGGHITFHQGNFYITSFRDHKILKVTPNGKISLLAGTGVKGNKNGQANQAQFSNPNGIVGFRNTLYVNDKIVDPNGGPNQTIIRQIDFESVSGLFQQALNNDGIKEAKKVYKEYKEHSSYQNDNTENEMNRFGYTLLGRNEKENALEVFKLNTESYPDSFNTWDSLAEIYMLLGNKQMAIENYEKSLKLNPNNANATAKLVELRK